MDWYQSMILVAVASAGVVEILRLIARAHYPRGTDASWWQWGWRAVSALIGCGLGYLLVGWPEGLMVGLGAGLISTAAVAGLRMRAKAKESRP